MKKYISLLRLKHYIKNVLIFIPAFFGQKIVEKEILWNLCGAFLSFSLISSFIYIINDIKDCKRDRLHEEKKKRPIASGEIAIPKAIVIACVCLLAGGGIGFYIGGCKLTSKGMICIVFYIVVNLLYSFGLKNIAIVDVMILASGFVIRVLYGAASTEVQCSAWLILTVMVISLYLGLGKRRNELVKVKGDTTRKVLGIYSVNYLDTLMKMCITTGVVFYSLWSVDLGGAMLENKLVWTVPIVIAIVMKYELDMEANVSYGDPVEVVYSDRRLLAMVGIYGIVMFICKYL